MSDVVEVFEFWKRCAHHPRSCLDDKRRRLIVVALRWGYSVADLKLAILGITTSRWHNGENDRRGIYTDLGLCLRDGDHIDRFIKDGEQEIWRCFYEARRENERRDEVGRKREIPEAAKARMIELSRFRAKSTT